MMGDTDGTLRGVEEAVGVARYRSGVQELGAIYMQAGDADSAIKSFKRRSSVTRQILRACAVAETGSRRWG